MYNITLVLPDGRQRTFQSPTLTINGEPAIGDNHVTTLTERMVAELLASTKGKTEGVLEVALLAYPAGTFHVDNLLGH